MPDDAALNVLHTTSFLRRYDCASMSGAHRCRHALQRLLRLWEQPPSSLAVLEPPICGWREKWLSFYCQMSLCNRVLCVSHASYYPMELCRAKRTLRACWAPEGAKYWPQRPSLWLEFKWPYYCKRGFRAYVCSRLVSSLLLETLFICEGGLDLMLRYTWCPAGAHIETLRATL